MEEVRIEVIEKGKEAMSKSKARGVDKSMFKWLIGHTPCYFKKDCSQRGGSSNSFARILVAKDEGYESVRALAIRSWEPETS